MSDDQDELQQQDHYLCGCGYRFEEILGAYGCPNCEGDYVAEFVEARNNKVAIVTGAGSWRPVTRALIEAIAENGIGRVERFSLVKSPEIDGFNGADGGVFSRGKGKKRKPWESVYP